MSTPRHTKLYVVIRKDGDELFPDHAGFTDIEGIAKYAYEWDDWESHMVAVLECEWNQSGLLSTEDITDIVGGAIYEMCENFGVQDGWMHPLAEKVAVRPIVSKYEAAAAQADNLSKLYREGVL